MSCPACGSASNNPDAEFCRECWHKLTPQLIAEAPAASTKIAAEEFETCPACWKPNPSGLKFCKHCGSEIHAAAAVAMQPTQPQSPKETPPPELVVQQSIQPPTRENPPPEPLSQQPIQPPTPQEAPPSGRVEPAITEAARVHPPVEKWPEQSTNTSSQRQDTRPSQPVTTQKQGNNNLGILIIGVILLLGGGGAYFWWQQSSDLPPAQEPSASQQTIATAAKKDEKLDQPQQNVSEPAIQPQEAEATVGPVVSTEPQLVPPAPTLPATTPITKPVTELRTTTVAAKPAPIESRPSTQTTPAEHAPIQPKSQHKQTPPTESNPETVPEIVARECAKERGFKHVICEEKVRFKLCDGQWGTKPGCPKYEHDDPFKF